MRSTGLVVLCVATVVTTARSACAQPLSLQIVTPTGIVVTANQAQNSVPPLTDLTAGRLLAVADPLTQSTASVQITPTSSPTQGQVASWPLGCGPGPSRATTGLVLGAGLGNEFALSVWNSKATFSSI